MSGQNVTTNTFLPKLTFPIYMFFDSGDNGENCADEQISAQIEVPYSRDNGENCADEQISAEIEVPYLENNGKSCADEQISAQIEVPY